MSSRPTPWGIAPTLAVPPVTTVAPAAPTAPTAPQACACVTVPPAPKPTYARPAGKVWSVKERELAEHAFRTAGLSAAYNAVPHRTRPAVRGWLQRRGLVPKTPTKPPFTP